MTEFLTLNQRHVELLTDLNLSFYIVVIVGLIVIGIVVYFIIDEIAKIVDWLIRHL